jgi:hypothetical protein
MTYIRETSLDTSKRIDYNEDLELVLFRWRYLLKSPNPKEEAFVQYRDIIKIITNKVWRKFSYTFSVTGYALEDIISLSNIYLIGFLGNFSLEAENKVEKYRELFLLKNNREPEAKDYLTKNKSIFTNFLIQRLEEAAKVCSQKNRNIRGTTNTYEAYIGDSDPNVSEDKIKDHPQKYGLNKLSMKDLNNILKDYPENDGYSSFYTKEGKFIKIISAGPQSLKENDYQVISFREGQAYYKDPESNLLSKEEDERIENLYKSFDNAEIKYKIEKLSYFIMQNKNNIKMKDEVKTARTLLRTLEQK